MTRLRIRHQQAATCAAALFRADQVRTTAIARTESRALAQHEIDEIAGVGNGRFEIVIAASNYRDALVGVCARDSDSARSAASPRPLFQPV